jgi:hypothetical protein
LGFTIRLPPQASRDIETFVQTATKKEDKLAENPKFKGKNEWKQEKQAIATTINLPVTQETLPKGCATKASCTPLPRIRSPQTMPT